MDQLAATDDNEVDKSADIKAAFIVDTASNFLHCVSSAIADESHDVSNGHKSETLPENENVIDSNSNGCESDFKPPNVDKCDQMFDTNDHTADGIDASETNESVSDSSRVLVSNSSAVGQYLAGFSVNDINEDESVSFVINETDQNHATSIQLDCTAIDANNFVPAIVDISGSSLVQVVNKGEFKIPDANDTGNCNETNQNSTNERNEFEIPHAVNKVDTVIDENCSSNVTGEEQTCITENHSNTEETVKLVENASQEPTIENNVGKEQTSLSASAKANSNVPLITISSDSEMENHSASKMANRLFSSTGYMCHLCDITFQEHEALNEHMILHRNNRLIETKVRDKTNTKSRSVPCHVCKKQLPSLQALQLHAIIHKNKKQPKKELGSNNRIRRFGMDHNNRSLPTSVNSNPVQKVDFGRLSGPLFIKRLLSTGKTGDSVDNDVLPLNVFSNVDNIVMNPARFIVRVDRMDANTVKRRIASPDISIGESSKKKRRVSLSPLVMNRKDVKLDEIENIILDDSKDESVDNEPNRDDAIEPVDQENVSQHGKLTEDELLALLNDESPKNDEKSNEIVPELKRNFVSASLQSTATTTPCARSPVPRNDENDADMLDKYDAFDVAFHKVALRRLALLGKRASENDGKVDRKYLLGPRFWRKTIHRAELGLVELEPTNVPAPVASTTLFDRSNQLDERQTNSPTKLQARAERKFRCLLNKLQLLDNPNGLNLKGPLFWKQTLRLAGIRSAADLKMFLEDTPTNLDGIQFVDSNEIARLRLNSRTKRVELKKKAGLEFLHTPTTERKQPIVKPSPQINSPVRVIDLTSPPVTPAKPKKMTASRATQTTFATTEILSTEETISTMSAISEGPTTATISTTETISTPAIVSTTAIVSTVATTPTTATTLTTAAAAAAAAAAATMIKSNDISYNSPTKRKDNAVIIKKSSSIRNAMKSRTMAQRNMSLAKTSKPEIQPTTPIVTDNTFKSTEEHKTESNSIVQLDDSVLIEGDYILNVDGTGALQLVSTSTTGNDKTALVAAEGAEPNYMLMSDEAGNMQYVLDVPAGEDISNLQFLSGGGVIGNGEQQQFTYAIEFDGENYTAMPIVQNADFILPYCPANAFTER